MLVVDRARAYVNHDRWIADCIRPYCANAESLQPRQGLFHCTNCRQMAEVEWPSNPDDIWRALARRPVPQTRNWFPSGHELAVRAGCPHGQTVADLEDENQRYGVT